MSRKLWGLVLSAVAAVVVLGAVGTGLNSSGTVNAQEAAPTPTATPVTTGNIQLVAISPDLCQLLLVQKSVAAGAGCRTLTTPSNLMAVANVAGNNDGIIQPSDFASIDLDGNQLHQQDPFLNGVALSGNLFIIAFVPNAEPVTFRTNAGVFVPPNQVEGGAVPNADPAGQTYLCDTTSGSTGGPEDPDCDPSSAPSTRDGVVVARLRANFNGTTAPITAPNENDTVTVTQSPTDSGTIGFRVVGEPRTLSFTTLETTIQDGVNPANAATECPLGTDATSILGANATAERSVVLAVAKDIDGNAVTGAVVNWSTNDSTKAIMAAGLTPTLDLGSFGFGAPNIICGTTNPGTVTVNAVLSANVVLGSNTINSVDPAALPATATTTFTVVGAPAVINLTADPASLACDGTATSKVTATVTDASGNPVAAGQIVNFNVQVVGSANPINPTTDSKGVATSVISPLSTDASGVPVVVTAGSVSASILVSCITAAPTVAPGAPPPPAGGPGGTGVPPTGTITGPNTGTGDGTVGGGQPWWLYLIALSAFGLLTGSALVWTGARAKRQ